DLLPLDEEAPRLRSGLLPISRRHRLPQAHQRRNRAPGQLGLAHSTPPTPTRKGARATGGLPVIRTVNRAVIRFRTFPRLPAALPERLRARCVPAEPHSVRGGRPAR